MPHTVPSSPMNGDTEPVVARKDKPLCSRLATLSTEETAARLADGETAPHALTAGYQLAFTVAAVLLVVAVVVAATVLKPPVRQEAVAGEPAYEVG